MRLLPTLFFLTSFLPAQTYVTSPVDFDTREGDTYGYGLGAFPDGRYMALDGGFRGQPMTLKGTAYRCDDQSYTTAGGAGRNWQSVELWVSECDTANRSATYSANPTTTPTRVFQAPVSWPDLLGKPLYRPATWSIQFPFQTNFAYTGQQDLCLDYRFAGGVLSNSGTWSSSLNSVLTYRKDSETATAVHETRSDTFGKWGTMFGACSDRGSRTTNGAYLRLIAKYYGAGYATSGFRDRLTFVQDGFDFGVSTPVVTALGFKLDRVGIPLPGVTCNNLHIDLSLPMIWYRQITSISGTLPRLTFGTGSTGVPANPSFEGFELVTQAAWNDTRNKQLLLSAAAQIHLPSRPVEFKRWAIYGPSTTAADGIRPSDQARYNEIARYAR